MCKLVSPFTSLRQGTENVGHCRELSGDNKAGVHLVGRNDDNDDDDDNDNHDYNNNQAKFSLSTPWNHTGVEV